MSDSESYYYINLEKEKKRIINKIKKLENEAKNSQKDLYKKTKLVAKN